MLGNKIQKLRKENNLTQEELAEKIDVTRQTISKWELNESTPDIIYSKKIAETFNISLDELLEISLEEQLIKKIDNNRNISKLTFVSLIIIGILIVGLLIILIINNDKYNNSNYSKTIDKEVKCELNGNTYIRSYSFYEKTGHIFQIDGNNFDFIEELNDADYYIAIKQIEEYFSSKGSTCVVRDM